MFAIFLSTVLFWTIASSANALTINFDDLDASGGDIDLSGANYQGYTWSNFSAYTSAVGFDGFNNGIVSPNNAAYSGGEIFGTTATTPVVGTLSGASLFDFSSAYLNAAYYDNLAITVEGLLNGAILFSNTVTVSTAGAQLFNFGFSGINELAFFASKTANVSDPFNCGDVNCTQFTIDDLTVQDSTVPEPPSLLLLSFGWLILNKYRGWSLVASFLKHSRQLLLMLVVACFAIPSQADEASNDMRVELSRLSAMQFAEPLIPTSETALDEDKALLAAIQQYQAKANDDDYHALTDFVAAYPDSGWRVALQTNLGLSY